MPRTTPTSRPESERAESQSPAPSISLPTGGGAIRGIGEKFNTNPVTGTGSFSVPLKLTPGRNGFGPDLSLSYDSGNGNGPFGLGWQLSTPAVTRKTDKGLPRYRDAEDSDVFLLSGAEDLVPQLRPDGTRFETRRSVDGDRFAVLRFRPRVEGLFARIERWSNLQNGQSHWRSITRDNLTTVYGRTAESRIADPEDPTKIFGWLVCEVYDDRGNAMLYRYQEEDAAGIDAGRVSERQRLKDGASFSNRHLKRILYGNRTPHPRGADLAARDDWLFEAVLDYGDHDPQQPQPGADLPWPVRSDPFSTFRAGFEVRSYRLCRRVLVFHHLPEQLGAADVLTASTDLRYRESPVSSFLESIEHAGYRRRGDGSYVRKSWPPVEFSYSEARIDQSVRRLDAESAENLPVGVDGSDYQWVDLNGEGLTGVVTRREDAWYYKPNLGGGRLGPQRSIAKTPSAARRPNQTWTDLAGDGRLDLLVLDKSAPGFYEHGETGEAWTTFKAFASRPNLDWSDPSLRFVDLSGDGLADLLLTEERVFVWRPALGEAGYGSSEAVEILDDEENTPRLVYADGADSIYLADMSGDGLSDLVRIRNGAVSYWPNLGYGRFGPRVAMDDSPFFDSEDRFDQRRIRLADLDGSGVADLVYFGAEGAVLWFNESGNGWSAPARLDRFPQLDSLSDATVVDLLGNGTACLIWSSRSAGGGSRLLYIDLMGGVKPHLLISMRNNLGAETRVRYAPSTRFYVQDLEAGKPWVTRLPFPVQVVEEVEVRDLVSRSRLTTRFAYHHGYFDGAEREFRGFGMVEQWDTEVLSAPAPDPPASNEDPAFQAPPRLTRSWYHTGAYLAGTRISRGYEGEYYREPGLSDAEFARLLLPDTVLPADTAREERRDAVRALRGSLLRREVYGLDGSALAGRPYTVAERSYGIRRLQGRDGNSPAVFLSHPREQIEWQYERDPSDPRVSHKLVLAVDDFGNVLESASVGYPRRSPDTALAPSDRAVQARMPVTYTIHEFTAAVDEDDDYRSPLPGRSRNFELTGLELGSGPRLTPAIVGAAGRGSDEIGPEEIPDGSPQRRLLSETRTLYRADDLSGPLPLGSLQSRALPFDSYRLAFTSGMLADVFDGRVTAALLSAGGYRQLSGSSGWWAPAVQVFYSSDPAATPAQELTQARNHFFLPRRIRDRFNGETGVDYDAFDLLPTATTDPVGNRVNAVNDYRLLRPQTVVDPNGNRSAVLFDALGLVAATAVMGKEGEALGDSLVGVVPDLDDPTVQALLADPLADPHSALGNASTRLIYDLERFRNTRHTGNPQPAVIYRMSRERHQSELDPGEAAAVQHGFAYWDGFGREIQRKIQAEPEGDGASNPRWVGTGWTIYDNKGRPVRTFEPFFSANPQFEEFVEGVSSTVFYDPLGRTVGTLHPNRSYDKIVFSAWRQETWDSNDTVVQSDPGADPDVGFFLARLPVGETLPTWRGQRISGALGAEEQRAAQQASDHADTPGESHLDSLGRSFLTIADNGAEGRYRNRLDLDIQGRIEALIDARGRPAAGYRYSLNDLLVRQQSVDAGERWMLPTAEGKPYLLWDQRDHRLRITYDAARRADSVFLKSGAGTEILVEKTVWGEVHPDSSPPGAGRLNLRGRIYIQLDGAGAVVNSADNPATAQPEGYDFKGNLLRTRRRLARVYDQDVDWSPMAAVLTPVPGGSVDPAAIEAALDAVCEVENFQTGSLFDALNRAVELTTPDGTRLLPSYNEANLLESLSAHLRGDAVLTLLLGNVDYNPRGQRLGVEYGSGAATRFEYDPATFRLRRQITERPGSTLLDLNYTYDPVGNATAIRDQAQQDIFFNNLTAGANRHFLYDALYRLIGADGREHVGAPGSVQPQARDLDRIGLAHPGDGQAIRRYNERYEYDEVGNLLRTEHRLGDLSASGAVLWNRRRQYRTGSNRLLSSSLPGDADAPAHADVAGYSETYAFDAHGNMTGMPHLSALEWNYKDQLRSTRSQAGGDTVFYVYDTGGRRLRKVVQRGNGTRREERIYLGGFETWRRFDASGDGLRFERESLHVMDGNVRLALVETTVADADAPPFTPTPQIRYQHGDHLSSALLELDQAGLILSYEEYSPYGRTAYQTARTGLESRPKRCRFIGRERDDETGLYHLGARYYAPWLGLWTSPDPGGLVDGPNLYRYSRNNPVMLRDPTGLNGEDESEIDLGPFRLTDPSLTNLGGTGSFSFGLNIFSEDPSIQVRAAELDAELSINSDVSIPSLGFSGTGEFDLNLRGEIIDERLRTEIQGEAELDLSVLELELSVQARGTALIDHQIYLNRLDRHLARTLSSFQGEADVTGRLELFNRGVGFFRLSAEANGGIEGPLSMDGYLRLGSYRFAHLEGSGSFSQDRFDLDGSFHGGIPPLFYSFGSFSYGISEGLTVSGHYFGPQYGPIGINPAINPTGNVTDDTTALRIQDALAPQPGGGAVLSFEPGPSLGYTFYRVTESGSTVFAAGFSPTSELVPYFAGGVSQPFSGPSAGFYTGFRLQRTF